VLHLYVNAIHIVSDAVGNHLIFVDCLKCKRFRLETENSTCILQVSRKLHWCSRRQYFLKLLSVNFHVQFLCGMTDL
jgi:hypothetical protein